MFKPFKKLTAIVVALLTLTSCSNFNFLPALPSAYQNKKSDSSQVVDVKSEKSNEKSSATSVDPNKIITQEGCYISSSLEYISFYSGSECSIELYACNPDGTTVEITDRSNVRQTNPNVEINYECHANQYLAVRILSNVVGAYSFTAYLYTHDGVSLKRTFDFNVVDPIEVEGEDSFEMQTSTNFWKGFRVHNLAQDYYLPLNTSNPFSIEFSHPDFMRVVDYSYSNSDFYLNILFETSGSAWGDGYFIVTLNTRENGSFEKYVSFQTYAYRWIRSEQDLIVDYDSTISAKFTLCDNSGQPQKILPNTVSINNSSRFTVTVDSVDEYEITLLITNKKREQGTFSISVNDYAGNHRYTNSFEIISMNQYVGVYYIEFSWNVSYGMTSFIDFFLQNRRGDRLAFQSVSLSSSNGCIPALNVSDLNTEFYHYEFEPTGNGEETIYVSINDINGIQHTRSFTLWL